MTTMSNIHPDQLMQQAMQLYRQARLEEVEKLCTQILSLQPRRVDTLNLAGITLLALGKEARAEALLRQALAIEPNAVYSINNLGLVLASLNKFEEAAACFRQVLAQTPDAPSALNNLGDMLGILGHHDEALACCQHAVKLAPQSVETHTTLGMEYFRIGRFAEARRAFDNALALDPEDSQTRTYYAGLVLLLGDLEDGWRQYEYRGRETEYKLTQGPEWDGGPIEGKTILVQTEQGLGDNIQFVRYLALLHERGAKVLFQCRPEMHRLLSCLKNVTLISRGEPLPPFDVRCRLMSLPYLFRTRAQSIPATHHYLTAEPAKMEYWRQRLPQDGTLKVGVVWAGNPKHSNDQRRSMIFSYLLPILQVPNVTLVSLQKGPSAVQSQNRPAATRWMDWTAELTDLTDTAALIANLDLVISVDTAMAHLSAALGRPVWTMLPFVPEFRWLLDRPDTPWYPTMRLFRQQKLDDWADTTEQVAMELKRLASRR